MKNRIGAAIILATTLLTGAAAAEGLAKVRPWVCQEVDGGAIEAGLT